MVQFVGDPIEESQGKNTCGVLIILVCGASRLTSLCVVWLDEDEHVSKKLKQGKVEGGAQVRIGL